MATIQNIQIGKTIYSIKDGASVRFGSELPTASAEHEGKLFNRTTDGKLYICTKTSEDIYAWIDYLTLFNGVKLNENNVGNLIITGNLSVTGNISQTGETYVTNAEKVESKDDYIVMRRGNKSALGIGEMSGFEIENYDGNNNKLRLVADSNGVARIGDVGDEEPLLTRSESNTMTDKATLVWDSTQQKAVSGMVLWKGSLSAFNTLTNLNDGLYFIL